MHTEDHLNPTESFPGDAGYDFGVWPEIVGALTTVAIVAILFGFSAGSL